MLIIFSNTFLSKNNYVEFALNNKNAPAGT